MVLSRPAAIVTFLLTVPFAEAQVVNTSQGTNFWLGFMQNYNGGTPQSLDLFITSEVNTTGMVSMPLIGQSWPFTITANTPTTITLPVATAMHTGTDQPDNKSVHVVTDDPVSVFAINFEAYTADGTVVYPVQALGTTYRIHSYPGLGGFAGLVSEFLIVSQQDGTEVVITTTTETEGGHVAGVPFTVALDEGETYQLKALDPAADFTGSTIAGTNESGPCRPFAVFSGAVCTNVPVNCTACDHLFEQALPISAWGTTYYAVPFATTTGYTYRILSDANGTLVSVNGGIPMALGAGQLFEVSNQSTPVCFTGNQPFSVAQLMQGVTCSVNGDPSLLILNAEENEVDHVTFATVISTVITDHYLNMIVDSADADNIILNGSLLSPLQFMPFPACNEKRYASLQIPPGSHTLDCPGGVIAYVYGMGSAESYAYSLGSNSVVSVDADSLLCVPSGTTVQLVAPNGLLDPIWAPANDLSDTLAIGDTLIYVVDSTQTILAYSADEFDCGTYSWFIGISDPFTLEITHGGIAVDTLRMCLGQGEQVQVQVSGDPSNYNYLWQPMPGVTPFTGGLALVEFTSDGWLTLQATDIGGCSTSEDSIYVLVYVPQIPVIIANGGLLTCSVTGTNYQWFLNGVPIAGANAQTYNATASGSYTVKLTDSNGCSVESDAYVLTISGISELPLFEAYIHLDGAGMIVTEGHALREMRVFASNGQLLGVVMAQGRDHIQWKASTPGIHLIQVITDTDSFVQRILVP